MAAADRFRGLLGPSRFSSRDTAWTFVDQAVVSGATFLTTVVTARLIGVEQFGYYSLGTLFILLTQNLQASAIVAPMMAVRAQLQRHRHVGYDRILLEQSALFSTISGGICFAVAFFGAKLAHLTIEPTAVAVVVAVSSFQDFQRRYAFVRSDAKHALVCDTTRFSLFALALGISFLLHSSFKSANYVFWLLSGANLSSVLYSVSHTGLLSTRSKLRRYVFRRHFHFSAWMTGQAVLQYITTNAQFFFVGGALSIEAVGALRAAMNLGNLVNVLLLALENSVPVRMAHIARADGAAGINRLVRQLLALDLIVFAPLLLGAAFFGNELMASLYGKYFGAYGILVFWWTAINFASAIGIPLKAALRTFEQPRSIFFAQIFSCAVALVGTPLCIQRFGVLGGPVVLLIALVVFNIIASFAYRRASWGGMNSDLAAIEIQSIDE